MSCEVQLSALVENLDEIKSFFGLSTITGKDFLKIIKYILCFDFTNFVNLYSDNSWLNGVFITILSDTFCFGYGSQLVIMTSRYDKTQQIKVFGKSPKRIKIQDENFIITSLMCIPITGGSNYVDWTCVVVGLDNGNLHFYNSDNGSLLYEKQLHNENVLNIRMIGEDVTIYYPSCVVILQTSHLIPLLKSLKEMYSRAKTTKVDLMDRDFLLTFRKWDYKTDITISDALMIQPQKTCLFDHLVSESIELGFHKKYRLAPSQNAMLIATGSSPYISFYLAREGFKQNLLTDVAKAVVNKFTSKLPSWLTGSQPQQSEKTENSDVISETLYHHHDIKDFQRSGCGIFVAPSNHLLAAITDSLGRIILIDLRDGTMIRMWKGYREAQCAFIEVTEARNRKESSSESRRSGLFLVIYAPKKALIEIWCMQLGPKIATFHAAKHGFLLYNSHDISQHKSKSKPFCLFFDADENSLKTFVIPFHCILSESNSKSAEDFHHFKRLKMLMKNLDFKDEKSVASLIEVCEKLHTPEIKLKCLDLLTNHRKTQPSLLKDVIDMFLKNQENEMEVEPEEGEIQDFIYRNQLTVSCLNYRSLINCFMLSKVKSEVESSLNVSLELCEAEYMTVHRIVELSNLTKSKEVMKQRNVTFKDAEESLAAFLSSFVVNTGEDILISVERYQNSLDQIGNILFSSTWSDEMSMSKLQDIFAVSRISSEDIMKCFLHFWLSRNIDITDEDQILSDMTKFKNILDQVCVYAGEKVNYAYNSICLFWQDVRESLLESNNPVNSLFAALICRTYALKRQEDNQEFVGFEQVTQEECQWTLLAEKLNDVAVLSIFVSQFSANEYEKDKYEIPDISLKKILNDGKGIISELVASWLIAVNLPMDLIFKSSTDENLQPEEKNVIKKLEILREHFPYSLNASVILCYVIWDLLSKKWSKNLAEIHFLKRGIEYLALFDEKNYHLKHGLCVLLWNANFKIPLKATQKLINKIGKLPKEKLCLQSTMIPDFLMAQFLGETINFLDHFHKSVEFEQFEFKCEEILTQSSSASNSLSLYELILQQLKGNVILIDLHYEMVKVLELIAFLNIKYTKPMQSLFDEVCNDAFFMEINKKLPYAIQRADEIRQNTRIYFLKKAVSTTIDLIIECQSSIYFDDHNKWMEKIKILCKIWNLDQSLLERHQVSNIID